jgi:hypothetical protein
VFEVGQVDAATAGNDLRQVNATKAEYINRKDIVPTALPEDKGEREDEDEEHSFGHVGAFLCFSCRCGQSGRRRPGVA